jgi:tripartite-type tricarboxylate transporter receptor subunit TctC
LAYASAIYPRGSAGFDFKGDLAPVSAFAREPLALVINPLAVKAADLRQFMTVVRTGQIGMRVASEGMGTVSHLAIELFEERTGLKLTHVPSQGAVAALSALRAGSVNAAFLPVHIVSEGVEQAKLRVLAIAGRRRDVNLPDVPTFEEAGLSDFRVTQWFGLFAPRGTSEAILAAMHGAVQKALDSTQIETQWAKQGARVELESRAEFAQFVEQEANRWTKVVTDVKLTLD